jgi:hypothetical protein
LESGMPKRQPEDNYPPSRDIAIFDTSVRGCGVGAVAELMDDASIWIHDPATRQQIFVASRHFARGKTWPKLPRFSAEYGIRVRSRS